MKCRGIIPTALLWLSASFSAMAADVAHPAFVKANTAIQKIQASGNAPSMSDPAYATLVSQAFDRHVLDSAMDESLTDLLAISRNAVRTAQGYSYFGIDKTRLAPARVSEIRRQNAQRFQDELTLSLAFSFACQAKMALKLQDFWTGLNDSEKSDKKSVILQYRDLTFGELSNLVEGLSAFSSPANRQILLDALVGDIDEAVRTMTVEARRDMIPVIEKAAASPDLLPGDRKKLAVVQQAMTRTDCGPLCTLK